MKLFTRLFLILFLFVFCFSTLGQSRFTVINHSHFVIDSLVLKSDKSDFVRAFNIIPSAFKTILLFPDFSLQHPINSGQFNVYLNGSVFTGFIPRNTIDNSDTFYVFDHGWNIKDETIDKPKTFGLFLYNSLDFTFDSVRFDKAKLVWIDTISSRGTFYYLNYPEETNSPKLLVYAKKDVYSTKIFHDFNNWMNPEIHCWIDQDGIHLGDVPIEVRREYILDFDCMQPLKAYAIQVKSVALLSVKNTEIEETGIAHKRIIVDRNSFKVDPTLTLTYRGKKSKISFDPSTLENPKYGLHLYGVLEAKKRNLTFKRFFEMIGFPESEF